MTDIEAHLDKQLNALRNDLKISGQEAKLARLRAEQAVISQKIKGIPDKKAKRPLKKHSKVKNSLAVSRTWQDEVAEEEEEQAAEAAPVEEVVEEPVEEEEEQAAEATEEVEEVAPVEPVAEEAEPVEEEEEAWDYTQDESYRVDEAGTEWYQDDEGTWWYREENQEDWSAWEE